MSETTFSFATSSDLDELESRMKKALEFMLERPEFELETSKIPKDLYFFVGAAADCISKRGVLMRNARLAGEIIPQKMLDEITEYCTSIMGKTEEIVNRLILES